MQNTLESLAIKEPLTLGDLGSIFWAESYLSKVGEWEAGNFANFLKWCNEGWITHYYVPYGGGFGLTLRLSQPLKENSFACVRIFRGWVVQNDSIAIGTESEFHSAEGEVALQELVLPEGLVLCLRDLLLELEGEELFCLYDSLPQEEGDPLEVWIEFHGCEKLPTTPEDLLKLIAERLKRAVSSS